MNSLQPAECATWYERAFGCRSVVMGDPRAGAIPDDAAARSMAVDALTTLRWLSRPVTVAPRLLALAVEPRTALVLHHGADATTGDVLIGPLTDDDPPADEQLRGLGLSVESAGTDHDQTATHAVVGQAPLASALVFAIVAESEAPGEDAERPPAPDPDELPLDIYASEFIGLATEFGAPLESVWHSYWELSGVRWCLLNTQLDVDDVNRIPYRQGLAAEDFVAALRACNEAGLTYLNLPLFVTTGPGSGHVIHLDKFEDGDVIYHDPWPGRSLLAAGNNELGIAAWPREREAHRWCVGASDLQRVGYASLVEPAIWLPLCGISTDLLYADLSASEFFGFFHLSETAREQDSETGLVEIGLKPGNWQEHISLAVTVDSDDAVRNAKLVLDRSWLSAPETAPFALDLVGHFVGATVTQADSDESELLSRALLSMRTGGLEEALASGPPHLLNQFRMIAMAIAGAGPFARASLPCSTVRAYNVTPPGEEPQQTRLVLAVSRPMHELGALFEDQETGYFMDDYRAFLWQKTRSELERLNFFRPSPPGAASDE
jgi:hypothetical protein